MTLLADRIEALGQMNMAELKREWGSEFGSPAPSAFSKDLLALAIAYRIQEQRRGGLSPHIKRSLDAATAAGRRKPTAPALQPGTRLVREWRGRSHHVQVTDSGFEYRDRRYRSLTAIAEEITGAKWSGPRFFGLKSGRGA